MYAALEKLGEGKSLVLAALDAKETDDTAIPLAFKLVAKRVLEIPEATVLGTELDLTSVINMLEIVL